MHFDTVKKKSFILKGIQRKPLRIQSRTSRKIETKGTGNNFGHLALQSHTACPRYISGGITFGTALVIKGET
jgi:hypothetical protein